MSKACVLIMLNWAHKMEEAYTKLFDQALNEINVCKMEVHFAHC